LKKSFLNQFANYLIDNDLLSQEVKIILPSKRAIIFLKQELLNLIDKSAFLPQFFSIEAFTQNLTDLKLLDAIHLQFELFEVYKTIIPLKNQDSFEKFIEWAPIVLQDFNDLDSYLADADKLLNNLSALKRLENWFPNQEPTDLSINYLKFFETLNLLYKKFYQKLIDKQQAYQGLIYREAVNNLSIYINNFNGKLLFAGFNALNKAEEIIIQELLAHEKAELFWDIDQTFINANHPASKFINHYKSTWSYYQQKPFNWISSEFENLKSISIIGASKQVAQLKIAGELIDEITKTSPKLNTTALVLGDERLLNVALESLPKSVENVNITMGYALQNTPLASLFINLFKANLTALKFEKSNAFYYKDFEAIWNHPYILKSLPKQKNDIISFIKKNNFDFVDYHNFVLTKLIDASNIDFVFENTGNNLIPFIENCIKLINILKLDSSFSELEKEQLYRFYNLFLELDSLEKDYHYIADLKTLYHFYLNLLRNEKLFFRGEPLNGLQIMGLLETRALDFENLIITSVNEGILPAAKSSQSFLPFEIKKTYGLPTYEERDCIYAYHFFRLLQRAKNIYLIYNTEVDDFGASEKSRYISQLELLKPKEFTSKIAISNIESKMLQPIEIVVNNTIKNRFETLALEGLSPSAIGQFLKNPIDFYYSKILQIKDLESIDENIALNTFGTIIHDSLCNLYTPLLNTPITKAHLENSIKNIDQILKANTYKSYQNGSIEFGKNKLYFEMAKHYINKLFQHEIKLIDKGHKIKIIALETKLLATINVEGIPYPINLKGIADRIDSFDGKLRIIDYKTGTVELQQLKIKDFKVLGENEKYAKALQLLIYAYLYDNTQVEKQPFEAGIISFKKLNNYIFKLNFGKDNLNPDNELTQARLNEFEPILHDLLRAIFNTKSFIEKIENNEHY